MIEKLENWLTTFRTRDLANFRKQRQELEIMDTETFQLQYIKCKTMLTKKLVSRSILLVLAISALFFLCFIDLYGFTMVTKNETKPVMKPEYLEVFKTVINGMEALFLMGFIMAECVFLVISHEIKKLQTTLIHMDFMNKNI